MKTESSEHLKPRSQYADDAVQLAIAGKWDDAVKLNKFIIDSFGADEETQNRLGKALSELGKLKEMRELLAPHGIETISAGDLGLDATRGTRPQ